MKQYKVGIVGAGVMGRKMLERLRQHPRFAPVGLYDPAAADSLASLQALVEVAGLDLLYIASPPAAHAQAVDAAMARGIACLCEKPLANTMAAATAIEASVLAAGVPFAVNFPFALAEGPSRLVELVRSGALGAVESATLRVRFSHWPRAWQADAAAWLRGPAEGGFTREVLSHFVFLAQRLFGPAGVEVQQITRGANGTETRLRARLRHAAVVTEIDAAVEGDLVDDNRFDIRGTAGNAVLADWFRLDYQGESTGPGQPSVSTLDALARVLDGSPEHRLATVSEALAVVRTVEALLAGAG